MRNPNLKGLARIRNQFLGRTVTYTEVPMDVYDRWGDKLKGYVVCKRSCQCPTEELDLLGQGNWSRVYALDDRRALKIARQDDGYRRFAAFAAMNKGNPHLPVIHYAGVWGDKDVYVLERLDRVDTELADQFCEAVKNALNPFLTLTSPAMAEIAKLMNEQNLLNDLCPRNVMRREDGTIVITDPYYEGY